MNLTKFATAIGLVGVTMLGGVDAVRAEASLSGLGGNDALYILDGNWTYDEEGKQLRGLSDRYVSSLDNMGDYIVYRGLSFDNGEGDAFFGIVQMSCGNRTMRMVVTKIRGVERTVTAPSDWQGFTNSSPAADTCRLVEQSRQTVRSEL